MLSGFCLLGVKAEQQIPGQKIPCRALVPAGGEAAHSPLSLHSVATHNDRPHWSWGWKARDPSSDGTTPTRLGNLSLGFEVPLMVPKIILSNQLTLAAKLVSGPVEGNIALASWIRRPRHQQGCWGGVCKAKPFLWAQDDSFCSTKSVPRVYGCWSASTTLWNASLPRQQFAVEIDASVQAPWPQTSTHGKRGGNSSRVKQDLWIHQMHHPPCSHTTKEQFYILFNICPQPLA